MYLITWWTLPGQRKGARIGEEEDGRREEWRERERKEDGRRETEE